MKVCEIQVKSIMTKSKLPGADFVINPYIGCPHGCVYCYAEFMKRFTNHSGEEWGDFIDVKIFSGGVIGNSIKEQQCILISSVTDPYNYFEAKYNATRGILTQLIDTDARIEILTKSSLVLRDIALLKKIKNLRVGISLNTLDDNFRRLIEPRASPIKRRLEALEILRSEKINTYVFVSPIFPEITDWRSIVSFTRNYVDFYCFENLNLRAGYKKRVLALIAKNYPHLMSLYNEICDCPKHSYWENTRTDIEKELSAKKIDHKMYFYHEEIKKATSSTLPF